MGKNYFNIYNVSYNLSKLARKIKVRKNDNKYGFFEHASRFNEQDSQWFFNTREGLNMGPYQFLAETKQEFNHFMHLVNFLKREKERAKERASNFSAGCL